MEHSTQIKIGDSFYRKIETDDGHSWSLTYTVVKVTAKTVTVTDDRFPPPDSRYELITRKIKEGYNGRPAITLNSWGSYAYLA